MSNFYVLRSADEKKQSTKASADNLKLTYCSFSTDSEQCGPRISAIKKSLILKNNYNCIYCIFKDIHHLFMDKKTHPQKWKEKKNLKNIEILKITQSEREMHKEKKMDGWDGVEGSVLIHQTSNVCKLPRAWQCAIDTKNLHPCWKTILQNLFGSSGETIKQFKKNDQNS